MVALCISRKLRARSKQGFDRRSRYANKRPTSFTSEDGQSIITCGYDYMGRRYMKKVTISGAIESNHHYLYRGYLQIAALDLTLTGAPALWYTHWDPTEPVATRPLSIRKNGTWYTYGHDLTKNVTELYKTDGSLEAAYDYIPFGAVTRQGTERQPFQWSSEVYDAELGMVYYNYRHYNPMDGRWIGRDIIDKLGGGNLYEFVENKPIASVDYLGLIMTPDQGHRWTQQCMENAAAIMDSFYTRSPEEGRKACDGYTAVPRTKCTNTNGVEQKDDYPDRAQKICYDFVKMYSRKGKVKDSVICVAICLVSEEIKIQKKKCCDERNAARLKAHFSCYKKCMFLIEPIRPNRGFPEGGINLGINSLIPAFCREIFK